MSKHTVPGSREARRQLLISSSARFYRCPNSGVILFSLEHSDDKILCGCGAPNPACFKYEFHILYRETHSRFIGAHFKRFLPNATIDEYLDQPRDYPASRWINRDA